MTDPTSDDFEEVEDTTQLSPDAQSVDEVLAKLREASPDVDVDAEIEDVLAQAEAVINEVNLDDSDSLLAERTNDLQRLQAEYANYRKRVEREKAVAKQRGAESVVRELLPVWDAISQAASHEELTGGFRVVASEFMRLAEKVGLSSFGAIGDEFDPQLHDALMQIPAPEVQEGHLAQVIQLGFRLGDKVLRPARVAVAAPAE